MLEVLAHDRANAVHIVPCAEKAAHHVVEPFASTGALVEDEEPWLDPMLEVGQDLVSCEQTAVDGA